MTSGSRSMTTPTRRRWTTMSLRATTLTMTPSRRRWRPPGRSSATSTRSSTSSCARAVSTRACPCWPSWDVRMSGKSTLVNRMIGRREAVVEDVPGVTRDRVSYEAEWNGRRFILVDTGGWDRKLKGMAAQIAAQAERAINDADAVAVHRRRQGGPDRHRRGRGARAPQVRQAGAARRQQGRRRHHRARGRRRSGRSAWASRIRSPPCTVAAPATCWTRPSRCCPRTARGCRGPAVRGASRCWASPTSASPPCSTPSPAAIASSSTASPAPPSIPSTS